MNFAGYKQSLELKQTEYKYISFDKIKCQFNPDVKAYWLGICGGYSIDATPYYHYLNTSSSFKYEQLMKSFGRTVDWIKDDIKKFDILYEDIKAKGFDHKKSIPELLENPVLENKYNDSYEIWEGHRRLSICKFLDIPVKVKVFNIVNLYM